MLPTNPLLNATAPAGPHLPVALLRQYAAGTLAAAAQHRVEAHTQACPRCADVLAGLLQTPPATTDQALAQLQQRLRQRVQQAAPARQLPALRQHRWLVPQLAAAVALLLGLVAGGWWTWQQRHLAHISAPVVITEFKQPRASVDDPAQQSTAKAITSSPAAAARVRVTTTPVAAELAPAPVGGKAALRKKLRRDAAGFVPEAPRRSLSGTVQLRVTIGADGKIKKINVLRGLRADYDTEAQRLVREGPTWVPGTSGGRRTAQVVDVAIPF